MSDCQCKLNKNWVSIISDNVERSTCFSRIDIKVFWLSFTIFEIVINVYFQGNNLTSVFGGCWMCTYWHVSHKYVIALLAVIGFDLAFSSCTFSQICTLSFFFVFFKLFLLLLFIDLLHCDSFICSFIFFNFSAFNFNSVSGHISWYEWKTQHKQTDRQI